MCIGLPGCLVRSYFPFVVRILVNMFYPVKVREKIRLTSYSGHYIDGTQGTGSAAGSSVKMERILDDLLKKILYLSHWSVVTKKIPVRGILM